MNSLDSWAKTESNLLECVLDLSFVGRMLQTDLGFWGGKGGFWDYQDFEISNETASINVFEIYFVIEQYKIWSRGNGCRFIFIKTE